MPSLTITHRAAGVAQVTMSSTMWWVSYSLPAAVTRTLPTTVAVMAFAVALGP